MQYRSTHPSPRELCFYTAYKPWESVNNYYTYYQEEAYIRAPRVYSLNCEGEQALCCEVVPTSYVCQHNHSIYTVLCRSVVHQSQSIGSGSQVLNNWVKI